MEETILALITDLYRQCAILKAENQQLRAILEKQGGTPDGVVIRCEGDTAA